MLSPYVTITQTGGWVRAGRQPAVMLALAAGLLIYFVYNVTRFRLATVWPLVPMWDASIIHDQSLVIFALGDYPARLERGNMNAVFPYSPGAVVLFRGLAAGGPAAFMAAWLVLMAAGLVVAMRASMAQERGGLRAAWLLVGVLGLVAADGPVAWDLRNAQSNLIYLGIVLAGYAVMRRWPLLGGTLIGLSVSFKLYSGLLLLWLLVHGPRRAFVAAIAAMIALWLLIPAAIFGVDGTLELLAGWCEQVRIIGDPWVYAQLAEGRGGPPLVTLRRAVLAFTGDGPRAAATQIGVAALWTVWLAALAWYGWRALGAGAVTAPSRTALADWTVLLLSPLPFSPWFEPYHAAPILAGTILCVLLALDDRVERADRLSALAALAAIALLRLVHAPFPIRGLILLAQLFALTIALGLLRPRLDPRSAVEQRPLSKAAGGRITGRR